MKWQERGFRRREDLEPGQSLIRAELEIERLEARVAELEANESPIQEAKRIVLSMPELNDMQAQYGMVGDMVIVGLYQVLPDGRKAAASAEARVGLLDVLPEYLRGAADSVRKLVESEMDDD